MSEKYQNESFTVLSDDNADAFQVHHVQHGVDERGLGVVTLRLLDEVPDRLNVLWPEQKFERSKVTTEPPNVDCFGGTKTGTTKKLVPVLVLVPVLGLVSVPAVVPAVVPALVLILVLVGWLVSSRHPIGTSALFSTWSKWAWPK